MTVCKRGVAIRLLNVNSLYFRREYWRGGGGNYGECGGKKEKGKRKSNLRKR